MKDCPNTIKAYVMLQPVSFSKTDNKWYRHWNQQSIEVDLPAHRIVCDRCRGKGTHVNPNIDGHGLSSDDFDNDPDFRESYFNGDYDVHCHECKGNRVIDVVNYDALSPKMKRRFDAFLDQQAADEREAAWERKYCV